MHAYISVCSYKHGQFSSFLLIQVRTDAYKEAIMKNPSLIQGATVMDVGCGTGILR